MIRLAAAEGRVGSGWAEKKEEMLDEEILILSNGEFCCLGNKNDCMICIVQYTNAHLTTLAFIVYIHNVNNTNLIANGNKNNNIYI